MANTPLQNRSVARVTVVTCSALMLVGAVFVFTAYDAGNSTSTLLYDTESGQVFNLLLTLP
jgi:hypothetical protein